MLEEPAARADSGDGMSGTIEARWRRRPAPAGGGAKRGLGALGILVGSFVGGVGLAAVGGRFGPLIIITIPAAFGVAVGVLGRPRLAIAIISLTLPAGFISLPTDALGLGAAEIAVVLVVGLTVLRRLGTGKVPLPWSPPLWWAAAIVLWAIAATPGAASQEAAIKQVAQLAGGLLLAMSVLASYRSLGESRASLAVLLVVGSGILAYALRDASDLRAQFGGGLGVNRASGVFSHPNDLGAFGAILLMLGVGWTLGARTPGTRALGVVTSAVSFVSLAVSLSRGAWIGVALSGLLLLVILPQARRALLFAGMPVLLTGTILVLRFGPPETPQFEAVAQRLASITRPTSNPYDDRPAIYSEAVRQIREEPILGNGPGSFPFESARATSLARTAHGAVHAHNVLLTVGAETGLPNVLLVVAFTMAIGLVVTRAARRLPDPGDRALVAGIGAALFVQVGQGIVDYNLRNPVLFILLAMLTGLVLVARRQMHETEPPP